jgi:hypothetical protein
MSLDEDPDFPAKPASASSYLAHPRFVVVGAEHRSEVGDWSRGSGEVGADEERGEDAAVGDPFSVVLGDDGICYPANAMAGT